MELDLSAHDVLTTTRSVRKRLDFDRPVERSTVEECLDVALQAPTGGNLQGWQFVFVTDDDKKKVLGDIYARNFAEYASAPAREFRDGDPRADQMGDVRDSATYLAENMHRAPVLMVPCIAGQLDRAPTFAAASSWGSILPAVWSFMLALRQRAMGSAWTTIHLMNDGEAEAGELLGIPTAEYTQAGLFPIAYTKGTDFKPAKRLPLERVTHWDSW